MKNKIFIGIGILSVLLLLSTGMAATEQNPCYTQIKLVNQDPNPAVPGSYVKLLFEVSGIENQDCNGFAVKLEPEYPFSLDPGYESIQTIEGSTYVQDYKTSWVVPYKVRIAEDAVEGDYQIKLLSHPGTDRNFNELSAQKNFNITITNVQTNFDVVIQEASGNQVSLGIVNTGKNTANSVIVKIPQQQNFRALGISDQIVGNLVAGDYTIVSFTVMPMLQRNITRTEGQNFTFSGSSVLKVQIDYTDGIGERRSITKDIQFESSLFQTNSTTRNTFTQGNRLNQSNSSGISKWWYFAGIAVFAGTGIVLYRKFGKRIMRKKEDPDWVSKERTQRKK